MLKKFKNIHNYIGHGVWLYPTKNTTYPVKDKIESVILLVDESGVYPNAVALEHHGSVSASDVYMTKEEAITGRIEVLNKLKETLVKDVAGCLLVYNDRVERLTHITNILNKTKPLTDEQESRVYERRLAALRNADSVVATDHYEEMKIAEYEKKKEGNNA